MTLILISVLSNLKIWMFLCKFFKNNQKYAVNTKENIFSGVPKVHLTKI